MIRAKTLDSDDDNDKDDDDDGWSSRVAKTR